MDVEDKKAEEKKAEEEAKKPKTIKERLAESYVGTRLVWQYKRFQMWRLMRGRMKAFGLPRMLAIDSLAKQSKKMDEGKKTPVGQAITEYLQAWVRVGTYYPPSLRYLDKQEKKASESIAKFARSYLDKKKGKGVEPTISDLPEMFKEAIAELTGAGKDEVDKRAEKALALFARRKTKNPKPHGEGCTCDENEDSEALIGAIQIIAGGDKALVHAAAERVGFIALHLEHKQPIHLIQSKLGGFDEPVIVLALEGEEGKKKGVKPVAIMLSKDLEDILIPDKRSGLGAAYKPLVPEDDSVN